MAKKRFKIEPHDHADKEFAIVGECITLLVDYDDVDHDEVDKEARRIVRALNEYDELKKKTLENCCCEE